MTEPDYLQAQQAGEASAAAPGYAQAALAKLGVPGPEDWTRAFKLLNSADWSSAAKVCAFAAEAKSGSMLAKLSAAVVACREEMAKVEAAQADLARQKADLLKAKAVQAEELAARRAEFERQLEVDRANHVAKTKEHERALAAKRDQFAALLDKAATGVTDAA
jgi:hypothetical protein